MIWIKYRRLRDMWDDYGFEIVVVACIIAILILALFRIGKKGSWNSYQFSKKGGSSPQKRKRGPPRQSKGEIECRRVMEKIFQKPFPSERPDFLRNPVTGNTNNLELDCYCKDLSLAVEYSGIQHYKYSKFFHKNKEAFTNQKYRDDMKKRICKDYGINLIEVPYTVKIEDIEDYLLSSLKRIGYKN